MLGFLARGALGSLGIKIAIVGLAFLNQLVVTRLMGAEQYGLYVYAITWLGVLGMVGRLGTDSMLTRFAAAYRAEERWSLLKGLVRFGYRGVFVASIAVAGLALLVLVALAPGLGQDSLLSLRTALLLLPVYGLIGVGQALLYGFKRPLLGQLSEALLRLFMIGSAGLGYLYWHRLSAFQGLLCGLAAATVVMLLSLAWVRRALPAALRHARPETLPKVWLATALPLLYMNVLKLLLDQSDILLIGMLIPDPKAVGLYAVAMRLAELATFGLQAVALTLAPVIAELHTGGRREQLQDILTQSAYGIFAFTLATCLGLYLLAEPVLKLFGAEFVAAYRPMLILLGGQAVNALTGTVGYLMLMTGHQGAAARIVTASAIVTIGLNLALIPKFGLDGAAAASALGMALLNLAYLAFVVRRLRLNPTVFRKLPWPPRLKSS